MIKKHDKTTVQEPPRKEKKGILRKIFGGKKRRMNNQIAGFNKKRLAAGVFL